ncbi:MAG: choice-of-anchor D domain-containing protein [Nitrospirota bacterium]
MQRQLYRVSSVILCIFLFASLSEATTYYIRSDGGTAQQCTGMEDAAYPGSGENQACAWAHPFWALDNGGIWRVNGGDTLVIDAGNYKMGYGAPNTGWCDAEGAFACYLPPVPSGPDPLNPTRILGKGWDSGCSSPPKLWGTQRADTVLNLTGTSNTIIDCFEITDHSGCVESHANYSIACQRNTYPFGDWALKGIYATDSSQIQLRHLNIHGLAHTGIHAGRLSDWILEDVRIAGNGMAGWDGDIDGEDSNSGALVFRRFTVEWNGCAESYPDRQPNNCWAQTAGGYGDGFGQGGETEGQWVIEDSLFRYNTSDGIDILYARGNSEIEIRRTMSYGNAGDQLKVAGNARIENSLIVSNCGYFDKKPFTYNVDNCRAGGSALVFALGLGSAVSVVNSTIAGQGDCLGIVECHPNLVCNGTETVIIQNNIFQGYQEFGSDDTACFVWFDRDHYYNTQIDYNILYGVKEETYLPGPQDILQDPLFTSADLEYFDGRLQPGSPAIDSGLPAGSLNSLIPFDDIAGALRPAGAGVDRGAYEHGALVNDLPDISVSPGSYNFADITVGSTFARTFAIANTGSQDLVISSMNITGTDAGMFTLQAGTCPNLSPTLSTGGSCMVTVVFTPSSEGVKNAILEILSNDPDTPTLNIVLSGTGTMLNPDLPDLAGYWDPISQTCKNTKTGVKCKVKGTLRVYNDGTENALTSLVRYYLSGDAVYDTSDTELKQVATGIVKPGKTKSKKFSYTFPVGSSADCQYLIAVLDTAHAVEEISEANNQVVNFFDNGECNGQE